MTSGACQFCSRAMFFEERIIHETDNLFVVATLGQITDGGCVLILPKAHVPCTGYMEHEHHRELFRLERDLRRIIAEEYKSSVLTLEHGIVGQTVPHAHLHLIPTSFKPLRGIRKDFPESIIEDIPSLQDLRIVYTSRPQPYLYWKSGSYDGGRVCWNPPAPTQYFRTALARHLLRPNRANWRMMDPALDRKLWTETVRRLKRYFK